MSSSLQLPFLCPPDQLLSWPHWIHLAWRWATFSQPCCYSLGADVNCLFPMCYYCSSPPACIGVLLSSEWAVKSTAHTYSRKVKPPLTVEAPNLTCLSVHLGYFLPEVTFHSQNVPPLLHSQGNPKWHFCTWKLSSLPRFLPVCWLSVLQALA